VLLSGCATKYESTNIQSKPQILTPPKTTPLIHREFTWVPKENPDAAVCLTRKGFNLYAESMNSCVLKVKEQQVIIEYYEQANK
jgi:hypothetical protein